MISQPDVSGPRLQAVLYADIHGYARLVEQDEAGTILRLTRSIALIRDLVGDYGGSVVNTAGDGLVAVFPDAPQALRFAVEMQREMARESAWAGARAPVAWRVGISLGETFVGREGVYGHSVNLAARVQGFAEPGGICVTETVHDILRDDPGLVLRSLGRRRLKNISVPVEVFAVAPLTAPPAAVMPPPRPDPGLADASLAILPLENLSADVGDLHLCHGIVADLVTNLSRFRQLLLIARHSAFQAAAETGSLREIGRRLGVRYLLTGSFRRAANRLRIAVELVEAETENIVWSERYDGIMQDIFEFQDDITAMVSARVALQIDAQERRRLAAQTHPALYAYGLVLRGQDSGLRFLRDANLHARRLFEEARSLDPGYGRSHAAMSRTFNLEWRYNWSGDPDAALDRALALARRAVACDDLDSRGFLEMGLAHLYKKQHDEALVAYEHALALNPNDADLLAYAADCLIYIGQRDRAVQLIERAMRLNPYTPDIYLWVLGEAYFYQGAYARTIETLHRMQDPSEAHRLLTVCHALLDQMDEARHHARAVLRAHPNFTIAHWRKVPPVRRPEDLDLSVAAMRKAGLR